MEPEHTQNPLSKIQNRQQRALQIAQTTQLPHAKHNVLICLKAVELADQLHLPVESVLPDVTAIHGRVSVSAKLIIALLYTHFDDLECVRDNHSAFWRGRRKGSSVLSVGPKITLEGAKAEGWTRNPKWTSMPDLMLTYRSACFFARTCAADIVYGLYSKDELDDSPPTTPSKKLSDLIPLKEHPHDSQGDLS